ILLAGAGLLMRSFIKLQTIDLGMNPNGVLHARLPLPRGQYRTADAKRQFFSQLLARLHALPGVVSATAASTLPPYGGIGSDVEIPGKTHERRWQTIYQLCSEGYFQTLEIQLLRGRLLSAGDVNGGRAVAVINKLFADRYFGDDDPIGRQIRLGGLATLRESAVANPVFEVVGIVGTARNQGVQDPPMPEAFIPYTTTGAFDRGLLVKTTGSPAALAEPIRREIWAVDRRVAVSTVAPLTDYLSQFSYAQPRFGLVVLGVFAVVGLVLVVLGVFSMIAYTVARQTHEIGIRMALGAGRAEVLRMVLWLGVRLTGGGILVGVAASLAVTRVLASQLFGIEPHDPVTLVAVVLGGAAAALSARYFPARRAARGDPVG